MVEGRDYGIKTERSERASGDLLLYFITHNLISILFFFIFTISMGVYVGQLLTFGYIFTIEFLELTLFQIFPISIISSIMGRITAFYVMRAYHNYYKNRATKKWSELNKGINKIGLRFLITALITSFSYSIGIIAILSYAIFNEVTLLPLIIVYSGLKIGVYFFVRWLVGSKG